MSISEQKPYLKEAENSTYLKNVYGFVMSCINVKLVTFASPGLFGTRSADKVSKFLGKIISFEFGDLTILSLLLLRDSAGLSILGGQEDIKYKIALGFGQRAPLQFM